MRRNHVALLALLTVTLLACAAPQTHRFAFDYSPRQALRMIREILREQGYRIAVFDEPAGMLKTEHREFAGQEGLPMREQVANDTPGAELAQCRLDFQEVTKIVNTYTDGLIEEALFPDAPKAH